MERLTQDGEARSQGFSFGYKKFEVFAEYARTIVRELVEYRVGAH